MSATAPENQSTANNPYSAPKSSPSSFAKSYLTLAIGGGLAVATVLAGVWLFAQSKTSVDAREGLAEEKIFMERTMIPRIEPGASLAPPVNGNVTTPAAP